MTPGEDDGDPNSTKSWGRWESQFSGDAVSMSEECACWGGPCGRRQNEK